MLRRLLAIGVLGFLVAACDAVPSEQAALQVLSVAPLDGATDVSADARVTARFSTGLNESSLEGNFTLMLDGVGVVGRVSYAAPFRRAFFTPEFPLAPGEYTATLTTGVNSASGARLGDEVTWGFTVSAGVPDPEPDPDPDPEPDPEIEP